MVGVAMGAARRSGTRRGLWSGSFRRLAALAAVSLAAGVATVVGAVAPAPAKAATVPWIETDFVPGSPTFGRVLRQGTVTRLAGLNLPYGATYSDGNGFPYASKHTTGNIDRVDPNTVTAATDPNGAPVTSDPVRTTVTVDSGSLPVTGRDLRRILIVGLLSIAGGLLLLVSGAVLIRRRAH